MYLFIFKQNILKVCSWILLRGIKWRSNVTNKCQRQTSMTSQKPFKYILFLKSNNFLFVKLQQAGWMSCERCTPLCRFGQRLSIYKWKNVKFLHRLL